MRFKAVAFDIDGTLYPNSAMYMRSLLFGLRHFKLLRVFSDVRKQLRIIRPIENFRELQDKLVAEGLGVSPEDAGRILQTAIYSEWETNLEGIRLFSGVRELVAEIRERGIATAVLSDFPVDRKMAILGLDKFWDVALSAEDANYLKPNPEPFDLLTRRLGLPPEEILYVGNSYEYDVLGATGVGMAAAHLCRRPVKNSQALISFSNYRQLSRALFL